MSVGVRKTIYRKLKARAGHPFTWRIEGAAYPHKVTLTWSRSTADSKLTLDTGNPFHQPIDLGSYDRGNKHYEIDLSAGDIVFMHPTQIVLDTPGNSTVLVAIEVTMKADDIKLPKKIELQSISDSKNNEVVLSDDFVDLPALQSEAS